MTKPKYGIALTRSEVAQRSNAVRWAGQKEKLDKAITEKKCQDCNGQVTFKKRPSWDELRKRERCYDCYSKYCIERNKKYRHESMTDSRGYIKIWVGDRKVHEHVHLAEQRLGRRLRRGEMVHHINGIRNDNRPQNLLVCTVSYHNDLHWRMRYQYCEDHPEYAGPILEADKLFMTEHFSSQ